MTIDHGCGTRHYSVLIELHLLRCTLTAMVHKFGHSEHVYMSSSGFVVATIGKTTLCGRLA